MVELKASGQRVTSSRVMILCALKHSARHMTPGELLDQVRKVHPHVPPSTIYRTLASLRDAGLISETHRGGETEYEWSDKPHHHLVCRSCGYERSIPQAYFNQAERKIEAESGFRIDLTHVAVTGLCPECQRSQSAAQ
ncbi:MAG: transcriptional repressor [Chloroflexi bacterium]|nr:transcriptional repressor [Chloroflexota bacterium]